MRVAVITTSYPAGEHDPSGHFVRAEVRALVDEGHRVTLFLPSVVPVQTTPTALEAGVTFVHLPHGELFGWPGALANMRRHPQRILGLWPFLGAARAELSRRGPFDDCIAHWLVPSFWPVARDYEGAVTAIAHGSDVRLLERLPALLQRRIMDGLCRSNVRVRCVSRELAVTLEALAARHRLTLGPIVVAPCAIDTPAPRDKQELRRKLGLDESPLILIVGRLIPGKQIDIAIEAALRATGRAPTIVGDGPSRCLLEGQYPGARWLGQLPRDETLNWLAAADCLLSASEHEGAPTVIREARALGVPVVTALAGDLAEWSRRDPGLCVVAVDEAGPARRGRLASALGETLGATLKETLGRRQGLPQAPRSSKPPSPEGGMFAPGGLQST